MFDISKLTDEEIINMEDGYYERLRQARLNQKKPRAEKVKELCNQLLTALYDNNFYICWYDGPENNFVEKPVYNSNARDIRVMDYDTEDEIL